MSDQRPNARPTDVLTTLADFAIVTFCVDPDALQALMPAEFEPEVVTLRDGRRTALVSAVPFRDLDFRFVAAPWLRFAFGQTNYRAYIRHRGARAVWFFGTSLATPLVAVPRYLWRLPWHRARMNFDTRWHETTCERYSLSSASSWGNVRFEARGSDDACGTLDGFTSDEETRIVLTHPLDGYYFRTDGTIGHYSVWHAPLEMQRATAIRADFDVFERLGLVERGASPHSVLIQKTTEFIVQLPPQRYVC